MTPPSALKNEIEGKGDFQKGFVPVLFFDELLVCLGVQQSIGF